MKDQNRPSHIEWVEEWVHSNHESWKWPWNESHHTNNTSGKIEHDKRIVCNDHTKRYDMHDHDSRFSCHNHANNIFLYRGSYFSNFGLFTFLVEEFASSRIHGKWILEKIKRKFSRKGMTPEESWGDTAGWAPRRSKWGEIIHSSQKSENWIRIIFYCRSFHIAELIWRNMNSNGNKWNIYC